MPKQALADLKTLEAFLEDPSDRGLRQALNAEYWNVLEKLCREKCCDGKAENMEFTSEERLFIDFGVIHEDALDPEKSELEKWKLLSLKPSDPDLGYTFSTWISQQYDRILKKPEKSKLREAVERYDVHLSNLQTAIYDWELTREKIFDEALMVRLNQEGRFSLGLFNRDSATFKTYKALDVKFKEIETTKRFVENGKFMTPEEKRSFIEKQQGFEKQKSSLLGLMAELRDESAAEKISRLTQKIEETLVQISKLERKREQGQQKLTDLIKAIEGLSGIEIENALGKFITFHRDMVKLCANRRRVEPMSVLTGEASPLTLEEASEHLQFISEFDPRLFKSERVNITGRPKILIVPGYGNGMYDWKYNTFLIPSLPYREKSDSVVSAAVEYRLDCDEDKILLHSYHKLKDYSGVRSAFTLKEKFTKDYLTFIKQEARGYKVLPRDIRDWFHRYIAPKKREIKVPLEMDPYVLTKEQFSRLKQDMELKVEEKSAEARDYFILGTIYHYYEEEREALNAFIQSLKLDPDNLSALFNAGIMAWKLKEKSVAQKFFERHQQLEPQSWWSNVCREHLQEMQK